MAEEARNILGSLSVCATTSDKIRDLVIQDGRLIFIHDIGRIALDLKGKRTFYNQTQILDTEQERKTLLSPIDDTYYFVIETAIFWKYSGGWLQLTTAPDEIIFIGTELPELGQEKKIYVDKTKKEISVWDQDTNKFMVVADKTEVETIDNSDIDLLFADAVNG